MKYKALSNFENNEAGHIAIDYRNASAMLNFTHTRNTYMTEDYHTIRMAQSIKDICKQNGGVTLNKLDFLLKKVKLSVNSKFPKPVWKKNWLETNLDGITDFPKLKKKQLVRRILFGTFQLEGCVDYIESLLERDTVYELTPKNALELDDLQLKENKNLKNKLIKGRSKIIAVFVTSRHKRGLSPTTYNVFIRYKPSHIISSSIKDHRQKKKTHTIKDYIEGKFKIQSPYLCQLIFFL